MEKLHGKSGDIPKELRYAGEDNISKSISENSNDQVSSSNETINVEEEEVTNIVKKERVTEEATGNICPLGYGISYLTALS